VEVIRELESAARRPAGCAVTIGAYDGVHRGHIAVLELVRTLADERGLATAVVTFDRHPAQVVRPESAPKLLTTLEQKIELLEGTGLVDFLCVLTFDEGRRKETAEEFVVDVLVERLHAKAVVVGADFHFGYQRRGNVQLLERMGAEHGFEVIGLDLVRVPDSDQSGGDAQVAGEEYSSTLVRQRLSGGDVEGAARLLGRPYEVRGTVIEGDRRGRTLGFPTANLAVPAEICLPADGIYAGTFRGPDGVDRPAAVSLGRRPTFYDDQPFSLLEAYVLDFDGDLYGASAAVRFLARLRGEERFDSVDALVAQMGKDVEAVRRVISPE
jgi:riboflavin kinase/FMN adenylyltransferase